MPQANSVRDLISMRDRNVVLAVLTELTCDHLPSLGMLWMDQMSGLENFSLPTICVCLPGVKGVQVIGLEVRDAH